MNISWTYKKIGELLIVERGGSPRPIKDFITDSDDGINWIKISDATSSGKYIYSTKQKIKKEGLYKTRLVKEGDFILSNSMSFGRPYIMKTTGCIHDGWLVLREKKNSFLNKDFLYYLLGSPYIFDQFDKLAAGSTVRNLNIRLVSSVVIPVPSIEEQKEIVEILDQAFESIEKAKANVEKNIENAKELLLSQREIFFNKLSFDKSSQITPLNDLCLKIFAGGDKPKDFSKTKTLKQNIPVIANALKNNGIYGYTETPVVKRNSITVAARGSGTGHVEFRDYDYFPVIRLIVLIPDNDLINEKFLMTALKNLKVRSSGSAIPQLTVPMIKTYSIAVPNLEKQKEIVETLDIIDNHIQSLLLSYEEELKNLEELKKSILQKAFSGELTNKNKAA